MLPPDVRTVSVQTLHKTFACASSFGEKPNQFHIMEVEFFLATNSSVWLSAMSLHAASATQVNKEAGKKARHCP